MHPMFNGYNAIIFDCDGVIFDSNNLKVEAMRLALCMSAVPQPEIELCCQFFKKNFGKSRYYHVQYFIDNIITNCNESLCSNIISLYSNKCKELYLTAKVTPGFINAISDCTAKLFVASGSAQEELREILIKRGLSRFFSLVLGSPATKFENVANIMKLCTEAGKVLMVGDALSDFHAAKSNNIDFLAYVPFSNVKDELELLSKTESFPILMEW